LKFRVRMVQMLHV